MRDIKKNRKNIFALLVAAMCAVQTVPVLAAPSIDTLPLFTGTKNLVAAGTGALTVLIAAGAGFFCLKAAALWLAAPEEEKAAKKKNLVNTVIISVIATVIPGVLTWILAFYA